MCQDFSLLNTEMWKKNETSSVVFTAWLFITGFFLFVFLAMYCLDKTGTFIAMDFWAIVVLFFSTFCVLNAIVLLERWDATTLPEN